MRLLLLVGFVFVRKARGEAQPSSANCTWRYYDQELDHFAPGAGAGSYKERVCIYQGYQRTKSVLLYVGNESPVEEYVNNTGLMWEVGAEIGALLVFAEHRYEGDSVPNITGVSNCLSYCTVEQALADYAWLVTELKDEFGDDIKVVAVGGSYGGMLAAWMRQKYPGSIVGAIAASAPIWGFPKLDNQLDGSSVAVSRAFSKAGGLPNDYCRENLLGAWPFIKKLTESDEGQALLQDHLQLCQKPTSSNFISVIQDVFFDLAEANYPFPSTYVTSAVGAGQYPLPAWPVKTGCSILSEELLVSFSGNLSNVSYSITIPSDDDSMPGLFLEVDWDQITETDLNLTAAAASPRLTKLLQGVANIWSTWCNVSGTLTCLDVHGCTTGLSSVKKRFSAPLTHLKDPSFKKHSTTNTEIKSTRLDTCTAASYSSGSWEPLCCNDDLYLDNYLAQGIGRDQLYWPPNIARNATMEAVLGVEYGETLPGCIAPIGLAGYPETSDPWARHMVTEFGDLSVATSLSNIVFSNGLLDPWSAAGVYPDPSPTEPGAYSGPTILNLSDTVHALILDLGAHHLDLFFLNDDDPSCAFEAREFETALIKSWLNGTSA